MRLNQLNYYKLTKNIMNHQNKTKVLKAPFVVFIAVVFIVGGFSPVLAQALVVGDLVINEVFFNPVGSSESGLEWVEIYNPTNAAVSLDGLVVQEALTPSSPSLFEAWLMPVTMNAFDGDSKTIGQADGATNGVDASLDEVAFPPPPPSSIRDFYFVLDDSTTHTGVDLRSTSDSETTLTFTVGFQPGAAGYPAVFTWDSSLLPDDVTGEVQDIFGTPLVDLSAGSVSVPSPHTSIKFVVNRDAVAANRHLAYTTFAELSGTLEAGEYTVISGSNLNNTGDVVRIVAGSEIIDQVTYGNAMDGNTSDNAPVSSEGDSIGRLPNGADSGNDINDFHVMVTTQGLGNTYSNITDYEIALAAVTETDYTTASWDAYQTVVLANTVTNQNTQAEVDAATATITAAQNNLVAFDATIALTGAGQWALVSAPALLSEAPTVTDDADGAIALLVYRNGAFVVPSAGDDELVNPLSAFYIKTISTGKIGLKFATIDPPIHASKQLSAGWNLVGTNNNGLAENEFSSIQNTPTNAGMVTLFVPDTYNSRKDTGYASWNESANHDLNANPITALPDNNLSAYDGYWVFMDAIKAFVKNL